jgi:hypothetical protein
MAQENSAQVPAARTILNRTEAEQTVFMMETIDQGFPEDRADQMTMLIINRSGLAVPLIAAKIEAALKYGTQSKHFIDIASEMISYAGDEHALRAIGKLVAVNESRFGRLVGRTLDNAGNWRNPFTVAYRGLEMGDEAVSLYTAAWAESALASERMQHVWAEAMLDRYGKVPSETEWAQDPIASRLKDRASPELRQSVVRFAAEEQRKRERR